MALQTETERLLSAFGYQQRLNALADGVRIMQYPIIESQNVNMHLHSFFSYNANGWSPSRLAWEARKVGLYAAALCDFDVLDGLNEFLRAGLMLGLRVAVHIETRAYVKDYAAVEINSPGEPGVAYVMGAGFARIPHDGTPQAEALAGYRQRARERNTALIKRINARLPEIAVDYENDVLSLTPNGSATERHIVKAYINRARATFRSAGALADFFACLLQRDLAAVQALLLDEPTLEEVVRSKLVKEGGIGYQRPSPESFPPVEEFMRWVASCEAIPMATWLDGMSAGEKDGRAMLECLAAKGAAAVNIIPDRNWNIADPVLRELKLRNLDTIIRIASNMELPINIGTELNKLGQPFADNLDCEALRPYKETFLRGAQIMVGHTLLLGYAAYSYIGREAEDDFKSRRSKNDFFAAVGALPPLTCDDARRLEDGGPRKALEWFRRKVRSHGAA